MLAGPGCSEMYIARQRYVLAPPPLQVVLWDTADMEQRGLVNMSRTYFSQCVGVILVYDKGNLSSLFDLKNWVRKAGDSQWAGSLVLSLWCNDKGEYPNEVTEENRTDFTRTSPHPIPAHLVFDVNAKEGCNVDESFEQVIAAIHQKWTAASCSTTLGTGSKITLSTHKTNKQEPKKRCFC